MSDETHTIFLASSKAELWHLSNGKYETLEDLDQISFTSEGNIHRELYMFEAF